MKKAGVCAEEYKRIRALIMGPGGKGKGFMQQMSKQMGNSRGAMNPHNMQMNIQQMSRMLPPQARTPWQDFRVAVARVKSKHLDVMLGADCDDQSQASEQQ